MKKNTVWYLMLLHHSQTKSQIRSCRNWSGILCFYIILKLGRLGKRSWPWSGILCFYIILKPESTGTEGKTSLVSYAFTSFSNLRAFLSVPGVVWYLMLLLHSQTLEKEPVCEDSSGILCFYIILKLVFAYRDKIKSLVSYAFTSFSNLNSQRAANSEVWYLMLLHHSQTRFHNSSILT